MSKEIKCPNCGAGKLKDLKNKFVKCEKCSYEYYHDILIKYWEKKSDTETK